MAKKAFYILVTLFLTALNGTVLAAPEGGNIVDGSGSIDKQGNKTTVTQNSQNLVVDWDSFNVGKTEHVHFEQQSTTDSALNRIYDTRPSEIWGQLTGKGNIWLLNPNGVIFGKTAKVSTGGLVAAGLWMDSADFMSGRYVLNNSRGTGDVSNAGVMEAKNIGLAGANIENSGTIRAKAGKVSLASGERITVDFAGDGLMGFVTDSIPEGTSIDHSGSIEAGEVSISIGTVNNIYGGVINTTGVIRATGANDAGGAIDLVAAEINQNDGSINADGTTGGTVAISADSSVVLAGSVSARGNGGLSTEQSSGGSIRATADRTEVTATAVIDASGKSGGGEVLLGGGWQGKDDSIRNAENTDVELGASIKANALGAGDGGTVVVWSDNTTTFYGDIEARGGELSGDGGAAEVSGKGHLLMRGTADLRAPNGNTGNLLLDPGTVRICDGAAAGCANSGMDTFTDDGIQTMLRSANVEIAISNASTGDEDINIDDDVFIGWSTNTLSLNAGNNINLNGSTLNAGGGTLALTFGNMLSLGSATLMGTITAMGNTLVGSAEDTIWTLNGRSVTVSNVVGSVSITLTNVNKLQGGTGRDTFNVSGEYTGGLDGGGGSDYFWLYFGSSVTGDINGGSGVDYFDLYSGSTVTGDITGGAEGDSFILDPGSSVIGNIAGGDGVDSFRLGGTVTGSLSGGAGNDTFDLRASGSIRGIVYGGADTDTLSYERRSTAVQVAVDSGAGELGFSGGATDTRGFFGIDIISAGSDSGDRFTGNREGMVSGNRYTVSSHVLTINGFDTINAAPGSTISVRGGNVATTWTITRTITGNMVTERLEDGTERTFMNVGSVQGGSMVDTFEVDEDTDVSVPLVLNGGAGNDEFMLDAVLYGQINGEAGGDTVTFGAGGDVVSVNRAGGVVDSGAGDDMFEFNELAVVTGVLRGGGDSASMDFSDVRSAVNVCLSGTPDADGFSGSVYGGAIVTSFSGVNDITGGSDTDTITGLNSGSIWILGTSDSYVADGRTLMFSALEHIQGGSEADSFTVNGARTGNIMGGAGADVFTLSGAVTGSLSGEGGGDTFNLNSGGSVSMGISGGTGADMFDFNGGTVAGTVAGNADSDSLDFADISTALTVELSSLSTATGSDGFDGDVSDGVTFRFTGINDITGGSGTDSLKGFDAVADWTLGASDSYVTGGQRLTFSDMEHVRGGDMDDCFIVRGTYNGNIDGGDGINSFDLYSGSNITGNIYGGADGDYFYLNRGSRVTGNISGDGGSDTFYFYDGTVSGTVDGGADDDSLNFAGISDALTITLGDTPGAAGFSGSVGIGTGAGSTAFSFSGVNVIAGGSGTDSLVGIDADATWTLGTMDTYSSDDAAGISRTLEFSALETMRGGAMADSFTVDGAHTGNIMGGAGADTFTLAGAVTGSLSGEGGGDTFNLNAGGSVSMGISGGAGADMFDFNGGTVTGIVAGNEDDDKLDFAGINTALTVELTVDLSGIPDSAGFNGDVSGGATVRFTGVNKIIGGSETDSLEGLDIADSAWILGASDSYAAAGQTLKFSEFEEIHGGIFGNEFTVNGSHTGDIYGGRRSDIFNFDGTITIQGSIRGSAGSDEFIFDGDDNVTVTGGILSGNGQDTFSFSGRANMRGVIRGGKGNDTFNIGSTVTGSLSGEGGEDTFYMNADGSVTGTVDGGADTDKLSYAARTSMSSMSSMSSVVEVTVNAGSASEGFSGSATDIGTGGFAGIDTITAGAGGNDIFRGAIDGSLTGSTYTAGGRTLSLGGFEDLRDHDD